MIATTAKPNIDKAEIIRTFNVFMRPGQVTELRALDATLAGDRYQYATVSGYFDNAEALAREAARIDSAKGVYFMPNEVRSELLARAANRIRGLRGKDPTTANEGIARRTVLLIDFDCGLPSGISSSDEEHEAALARAKEIREWLTKQGWPDPVFADSGNGAHLNYRIDLPLESPLVERCLEALNAKFTDGKVKVDDTVHNPARIWKLYGTLAAKGDSTEERPHRMSRMIDVPDPWEVVPVELLEALAAEAPQAEQPKAGTNSKATDWRIEDWIRDHNVPVDGPEDAATGSRVWTFKQCPWNADHTDKSAYILKRDNGAIVAGCHHNGCTGKDWHALRDLYEPGWREAKEQRQREWENRKANKGNGTAAIPEQPVEVEAITAPVDEFIPYPVELWPEPVASFVTATADSIGCDSTLVMQPMIAALAAAVGNAAVLSPKRGWNEPCIVWTVSLAESGEMKSPAQQAALAPLQRRQAVAFQEYGRRMAEYERDLRDWEAAIAEWKKSGRKKMEQQPEKPVAPIAQRWLVNDSTVEALACVLRDNPRGVLAAFDELAGWFASHGRYNGSGGKVNGDSAKWLEFHRGGSVTIDRRTGEPRMMHIARASVGVTGGIQPATLAAALGSQHFTDGTAARMLIAWPKRTSKRWSERTVSEKLTQAVEMLFDDLMAHDFEYDDEGNPRPVVYRLDDDGHAAWVAFYNRHAAEMENITGDLRYAWAKLEGYCLRLALLMHMIRVSVDCRSVRDPKLVDAKSIEAAASLVAWYGREARRVYARMTDIVADRDVEELVAFIQSRGGEITSRDCMLRGPKYETVALAEEKLAELAGLNRVTGPHTVKTAGRPRTVWRLPDDGYRSHPNNGNSDTSSSVANAQCEKTQIDTVDELEV